MNAPKKNPRGFFSSLLRDIFTGGSGYRTIRGERTPFPIVTVACAIVATMLFLILIFSYIGVTELNYDIVKLKKQITSLEQEEEKLQNELDRLYPFPVIESVAESLGLSAENGETVILSENPTN